MTEKVITFIDHTTGDEVRYRRYSARVPDFLKAYSLEQGYRVEIEFTDLLSLQKGRLFLLRESVIAGRKPSDVGLPGIEHDVNTLVCTARLLDANDRMIRSARASMKILDFKDLEALETAANQRLLAALGFGGEVFDQDENRELNRSGQTIVAGGATLVDAPSGSGTDSPPQSLGEATGTSPAPSNDDEPPTEGERRHIENLAKRVKADVPQLRTRTDVKIAHQQLSQLDRQRRSNGHSTKSAAND